MKKLFGLFVVIPVLILAGAGCGGGNETKLVVQNHLQAMRNGKADQAAGMLASATNTKWSVGALGIWRSQNEALKTFSETKISDPTISGNTATVNAEIVTATATQNFIYQLITENDQWKIADILQDAKSILPAGQYLKKIILQTAPAGAVSPDAIGLKIIDTQKAQQVVFEMQLNQALAGNEKLTLACQIGAKKFYGKINVPAALQGKTVVHYSVPIKNFPAGEYNCSLAVDDSVSMIANFRTK